MKRRRICKASVFIVALQPFAGPWPLLKFLDPIHSRWEPLDGGSARRKAATYTQDNTNTEYAYTDILATNGIGTHDPSLRTGEDSSCQNAYKALIETVKGRDLFGGGRGGG
jgi:hypothetical protein